MTCVKGRHLPNSIRLVILDLARGVAQPGSALEWGSSGRRFKSSRPDQGGGGTCPTPVYMIIPRRVCPVTMV